MPEPIRLVDSLPPPDKPDHVKILCLGMSRTGTMSLLYALRQLGYSPYHMTVASKRLDHLELWNEALATKYGPSLYCNSYTANPKLYGPADIAKILRNFDVISDIPTLMFIPELLEAFPSAKIILTHHPKGVTRWVQSVKVIFDTAAWPIYDWLFVPLGDKFFSIYLPVLRRCFEIWAGTDWPKPWTQFDEVHMARLYNDHNERIRKLAKEHRRELLEFGPEMGWEPLCKFLGKDVPNDIPYPAINKGDDVVQIYKWAVRKRFQITVVPALGKVVGLILVVVLAMWWLRS